MAVAFGAAAFSWDFLMPVYAFAAQSVSITEIMYDPPGANTGHQWIEVLNSTDSSIDLTSWKLVVAGKAHEIKASDSGNGLPAGSYGIIAEDAERFLMDHQGFTGSLFHSSFDLTRTGGVLALRQSDGSDGDSVMYQGSRGGRAGQDSLQKTDSGSWEVASPTPGTSLSGATHIPIEIDAPDPSPPMSLTPPAEIASSPPALALSSAAAPVVSQPKKTDALQPHRPVSTPASTTFIEVAPQKSVIASVLDFFIGFFKK